MMAQTYSTTGRSRTRPMVHVNLGLIRWGAVWGGAMVATALFELFSTFWMAVAEGAGEDFRSDIGAWVGLTAIGCYFLGGALAGSFSARIGPGSGLANSMAVWALGTFGGLLLPIPLGLRSPGSAILSGTLGSQTSQGLWTAFASVAIGLAVSVIGGWAVMRWLPAQPIEEHRPVAAPAQRKERSDIFGDHADYQPTASHGRR